MRILGIESSAKSASCAIVEDGKLLSQYYQNSGLTHSRTLLPMIEDMLKNLGITISDIDLFACAKGPGSFTGIRIGVSTVKGLAWASQKDVCGVSTLKAMAYNGIFSPEDSIICCAMDARRNQFYNALFEKKDGKIIRLCDDRAISGENLLEETKNFKKPIFVVGDGANLCYNILENYEHGIAIAPEPLKYQSAYGVCLAALNTKPHSVYSLLPTYLRLSQAERERQERLLEAKTNN